MKTVADFKRKMIIGAKVNSQLFWPDRVNGGHYQVNDIKDRTVTIVQSNSFALSHPQPDGTVKNSWCDWPKKDEFTALDDNTAQITHGDIKLIYQFH